MFKLHAVQVGESVYQLDRIPVAEPEPAPEPEVPAVTTRILAIDDEPGIRALLSAALSHFDYDAVTVADGAEALNGYKRALANHQPYAAVIIDLTIPGGMGGQETIKALKEIDPNVKAIVSSGCPTDPVTTEFAPVGPVLPVYPVGPVTTEFAPVGPVIPV